jgi:hypothetical protein
MLKFLMKNALFEPESAERHIEHCPKAVVANAASRTAVIINSNSGFNFVRTRINVPVPPRLPAGAAVP